FDLVHQVSARGGARGGAFPGAHVSGAVIVTLVAWRHQRRLAYLLAPITGGVMIATVYGRFHYVLDTFAGAGLAITVVVAYRYLSGDRHGERQSARDAASATRLETDIGRGNAETRSSLGKNFSATPWSRWLRTLPLP